ncbi:RHS repeat-associated core domain-containing protein [Candidatus Chloroploca asiatica]|uniref:Uncharacterized protein n=1 Tax=Candidatus Chloroploca asiatica TaxID=1506545 RepID=A0A2H3KIU8_9CHLR|nr:RHS repeat-associated core domain-containing protein [Candidatus Chloroploca asiatica]PDV97794.1 hypothetical protein A9Q02_17560 [Candidatus Chloroploca asiatica]
MQPTSRVYRFASFCLLFALIVGNFSFTPPVTRATTAAHRGLTRDYPLPQNPEALLDPFPDPIRSALEAAIGPDADPLFGTSDGPTRMEPLGLVVPAVPSVIPPTPPNPLAVAIDSRSSADMIQALANQAVHDEPPATAVATEEAVAVGTGTVTETATPSESLESPQRPAAAPSEARAPPDVQAQGDFTIYLPFVQVDGDQEGADFAPVNPSITPVVTTTPDTSASPTLTAAPTTPTVTAVPATPTATAVPSSPTATAVPASPTVASATATAVPATPTATAVPVSPTVTAVPASPTVASATATAVPAMPTATAVPVSPTAVPATATAVPATLTVTAVPASPTVASATATAVPATPTATAVPVSPTATAVPASPTVASATATAVPAMPTATAVPVSPTATAVPASPTVASATATAVPAMPTATAVPVSPTAVPATATAVPATATAVPATLTATAVSATATAVPAMPTATAVSATATAVPAMPTATAVSATATAVPVDGQDQVAVAPTRGDVLQSSDGRVELHVPVGAVDSLTTITYRPLPVQSVTGYQHADVFFQLTAEDAQGNPVHQFDRPLNLRVAYNSQNGSGLALYYRDAAHQTWTALPSVVDQAAGVITATTDHFTEFALLSLAPQAPELSACETAGAGNGASTAIRQAFIDECELRTLDALGGAPTTDVIAFGGAYAQHFPIGSLLYAEGAFFFLQPEYVTKYQQEGGPSGWLGVPQTGNPNPTQAPATFVDENGNNFVGQDVLFLEKGFISKNDTVVEAHRYFPAIPGQGQIAVTGELKEYDPPIQGDPKIQKIKLTFTTGVDAAPQYTGSASIQLTLVVEAEGQQPFVSTLPIGPWIYAYPHKLEPGTPLIFSFKAARISPAGDNLVGYAPCRAFTNQETYTLTADEGRFTFENTCEGADGVLPEADTTPPTIHYLDIFQDGMGGIEVRALVTDNRAVARVDLTFNGTVYPMQALGGDLYGFALANGPTRGNNEYRVYAVDTSGNDAYFPSGGPLAVSASQAGNFGQQCLLHASDCDPAPSSPGFQAGAGDPVNTYNGNYTDSFRDLTVAGVGDTTLAIDRAYNSLAAFGSGGGTTRYTESGGDVKAEVIAGPPQYFGRAWAFPYAVRMLVVDNLLMQGAQVFYPDGRVVSFRRAGDAFVPLTPFSFDVLTQTATGYELRNKRTLVVEEFNGEGLLVARRDRNGNKVTLFYEGEYLVRVENASGRVIRFDYNADGFITAIHAPEGKTLTYAYTDGNLTSVTDARGHTTEYRYSDDQQLTAIITPEGHPFLQIAYDDEFRVQQQVVGFQETYRFSYSDDLTETIVTDSFDQPTTYTYDDMGRLIAMQDALGFTETYGYDDDFNRTAFTDRLGRVYTYTYDDRGNRLSETGPLGWSRAWAFNDLDQVTQFTDAEGRVTRFDYDARGNLIGITNAAGDTSTLSYDARGLPTNITDFNGNQTTNTYDATTGDLRSSTNGVGDQVQFSYDGLGRLSTTTNGRGFTSTYTFDGNDNLIQLDGPLGFTLRYSYDKNDNLITATDANGDVTRFRYDEAEQLVAEVTPLGFTTSYAYDAMNNLVRVEDAEGRVWTFAYDAVYNQVAEHAPEQSHTFFRYDGVGNLTALIRCNSPLEGESCAVQQVQELVYDDLDRVVTAIANAVPGVPASADTNVTTQFSYDLVGNLLTLTDANGISTSFRYDLLDRLVREESAAAQVTTYAYDPMGNLTTLTNPRGFSTSFSYDAANRLASVSDALQQTTSFGYDANSNLVAQTDPNGIVTAYRYNALDRLEALVQNERPGEAASSTQNVTTRFDYDLAGNLRFIYDPRGTYVTEHQYDADLRRVRTLDAEGGTTSFGYDRVNNLIAVTDANGHTTTSAYDGLNRLVRITNPEGHAVSFAYDQLDNLIRLTDARSFTSTYAYDGLDRVISFTDNLAGVWRYQYDPVGNLLAETDANGHTTSFAYDVVYRLLSRTDAEGYVTSWTYDANSNPLTRTDGNGHTSSSTYDALDRVATRTNAENETTAYGYDWMGNLLAMTEADGIVTGYGYDPLYRLSSVTFNQQPGQPVGVDVNVTTRYSYDEAGNLVLIRDANGNPTSFSFDGLNRLTREVDALGNSWSYAYDKTFNRVERIDALRNRTTYGYYPDDQLQRVDYHDGTFVAYAYDENNNVLTVGNELGTTTRSYDALNRLIEEQDVHERRTAFGYDPVGNRLSLTYPDGRIVTSSYLKNNWLASTTDPEGRSTRYIRDGVGQVVRQENPNSTVTTQVYDKANRLLSVENQQIGGANTVNSRFVYRYDVVGQRVSMEATYAWRNPSVVTSNYSYDPLRRLVRDEDSQGIWTAYTFDAVGNRLTLTTNDSSTTNRPFDSKTLHYSYNAINQLLSVVGDTHPGSPGLKRAENSAQALHAFRHEVAAQQGKGINSAAARDLLARADALLAQLYGNPTPNVAAVDSALASLRAQVETYQAEGELRNQGIATSLLAKLRLAGEANNGASGELQTVTYTYDANGNRINKEFPGPQGPRIQGSDYRYDPENRLVVVQDYQQNLQGNRVERAVTTMAHDGNGRRVVKSYDPKTGGGGTKQVEYVYDGLDPIAEYNTWNPQYENFYRGDQGRILQLHHFPSGTAGQVYWYHYDGLGSVAGLTKQQGQSSHNYRYEPYGQIELPKGNFSDPHNHYTFTGQEWNEHTGLYEFYARHYDPDTGTWMSQDPYRGQFSEPRSLHRYQYVYNSPVNLVDPYGYCPWCIGAALGAVGGAIIGGAVSAVTQAVTTGSVDWKEVGASAIGGAVTGGICGVTLGVGCAVGGGAAGGAVTQIASDLLHGQDVQWDKVAQGALIGAAAGGLLFGAGKALAPMGQKASSAIWKHIPTNFKRSMMSNMGRYLHEPFARIASNYNKYTGSKISYKGINFVPDGVKYHGKKIISLMEAKFGVTPLYSGGAGRNVFASLRYAKQKGVSWALVKAPWTPIPKSLGKLINSYSKARVINPYGFFRGTPIVGGNSFLFNHFMLDYDECN